MDKPFPAQSTSSASGLPARWRGIAASPAWRVLALLMLCSAYLQGGLDKAFDFPSAVLEMQHFGVSPAAPMAVLTIIGELVAPVLILSGFFRWLGALYLGGFTLMAMVVANRFWDMSGVDRFMTENAFFEHLGLAGAFFFVAWLDVNGKLKR